MMRRCFIMIGLLVTALISTQSYAGPNDCNNYQNDLGICCEVKVSSGFDIHASLTRHALHGGPSYDSDNRCMRIVFKVSSVNPLSGPIPIYEGVELIGKSGITLSTANKEDVQVIRVIPDNLNIDSRKAVIRNIKIEGDESPMGIRIKPRTSKQGVYVEIDDVEVAGFVNGISIEGDNVTLKHSDLHDNRTAIDITGHSNRLFGNDIHHNINNEPVDSENTGGAGIVIRGSVGARNIIGPVDFDASQTANTISDNVGHGIVINGIQARRNHITRNSHFNNRELGIDLQASGNMATLRASNQFALLLPSDPSKYLLIGTIEDDIKKIELFKSDVQVHGVEGEGKNFIQTLPDGTMFPDWDLDGLKVYAALINTPLLDIDDAIVTTVSDKNSATEVSESDTNTSEFSTTLIPSDDFVEADPVACGQTTNDYYIKGLFGLDIFGNSLSSGIADFWDQDSDGDGLTNRQEDLDEDCIEDDGETDPGDPDDGGDPTIFCQFLDEATVCASPDPVDQQNCVTCFGCSGVFPPTTPDVDANGIGDACEDHDGDGKNGEEDNCVFISNVSSDGSQTDSDGDGVGDVCEDDDGDGVINIKDNCPKVTNPGTGVGGKQIDDLDGDGVGDDCDPDQDNDGLLNAYCKKDIPGQTPDCEPYDEEAEAGTHPRNPDSDGDDYCDGPGYGYVSGNNATTCIPLDNCPVNANSLQTDSDEDTIGNECDSEDFNAASFADSDSDTIVDKFDNCAFIKNKGQLDTDGDGTGDPCDPDNDNDGIEDHVESGMQSMYGYQKAFPMDPQWPDSDHDLHCDGPGSGFAGINCTPNDNCPQAQNITQTDNDDDGRGNKCDNDYDDTDLDGILDGADNCVFIPNNEKHDTALGIGQRDTDLDGEGDSCDQDDDNDALTDIYEGGRPIATGVLLHTYEIDSDNTKYSSVSDGFCDGIGVPSPSALIPPFIDTNPCQVADNCPTHYNPSQVDSDFNGEGDACQNIGLACDSDGIPDVSDNCSCDFNPLQEDADNDGIGDACDPQTSVSTGGGSIVKNEGPVFLGGTPRARIRSGAVNSAGCQLHKNGTPHSKTLFLILLPVIALITIRERRRILMK